MFRQNDSPLPATFFTITFDQLDIITVHEAALELTQQLIRRFEQAGWSKESAFVEERMEIRLKEKYWLADGQKTVMIRLMLLAIVETLEQFDFRIYASLRAVSSGSGEPDALICYKQSNVADHSAVRKDPGGPDLVDV